jgi:hypothetical protein
MQPIFAPSTYYWIVLAPRTPLVVLSGGFNGVLWSGKRENRIRFIPLFQWDSRIFVFALLSLRWEFSGINVSSGLLPLSVSSDANIFTARTLKSQRFRGDATFAANTTTASNFTAQVSFLL